MLRWNEEAGAYPSMSLLYPPSPPPLPLASMRRGSPKEVKRLSADPLLGKLRKKVWINVGDIILLSLRSYQDEKGDVILKYNADEARSLKAYGELPETAKINETDLGGPEGDGDYSFEFDEDRDSDSSDEEAGAGGKEIEIDDI